MSRAPGRALLPLALSLGIGIVVAIIALAPSRAEAAPAADEKCVACHAKPDLVNGDGKSMTVDPVKAAASLHGKASITCVDCHADLADTRSYPHPTKLEPVDCAGCHDGMAPKHPFHPQMAKHPEQVTCQECHGGHDIVGTKTDGFKFKGPGQVAACGGCHESMRDEFVSSDHGHAWKQGVKEAPDCVTCHSVALTTAPDGAPKNQRKVNQDKLCLSCHLDDPAVRARVAPSAGFIASYRNSVHGRALAGGDDKAPACSDCHGSHAIKNGQDSTSQSSKGHIQDACAECHADIAKQFQGSAHGVALAKGAEDAPTCTTCHGEHNIKKHDDPTSPVAAGNVSREVCAPCHQSVQLTAKYGIESDRFSTFEASFHGLAMRGGVVEVANCASCHGAHDIRPSSDPRSRIHPANLVATCGKCHPGANENFAKGPMHVAGRRASEPIVYWIATLYLILICVVIGGMLGHNLLDFLRKARRRYRIRRGDEVEEPVTPHRLYLRMTRGERLQHMGLLVSFCTLVLTGFLLRYPDASWAETLKGLSPGLFGWRSTIHRVAAVILVLTSVYHIGYCVLTARGRQFIRDLWPRRKDLGDAIGVLKYNLGLRTDKPKLDRFSYIEKAEYWALVWGTVVMTVTGVFMWFENTFMGILTKLGYDISRTVHFYEAWLATLAIVVWHFYFVLFNPDSYPMNLSWLTGKLTEREMLEEHPLELERIKEHEEREAQARAEAAKAAEDAKR